MANSQVSGLFAVQTSVNLDTNLDIGCFFGNLNPTGGQLVTLSDTAPLATMQALYGYTSGIELETFVYSGEVNFKFVVPLANLTGTMFEGTIRLSQLFNSSAPGVNNKFTINQLITCADNVKNMQSGFSLKSAIVNDYILTHTLRSGPEVVTTVLDDSELGSEIVHYVILQRPSMSITATTPNPFSLIGEVRANSVIQPGVSNLLLYRKFRSVWQGSQRKAIDFSYQGPLSPMGEGPPPKTEAQVIKKIERATPDIATKKLEDVIALKNDTHKSKPWYKGITGDFKRGVKRAEDDLAWAFDHATNMGHTLNEFADLIIGGKTIPDTLHAVLPNDSDLDLEDACSVSKLSEGGEESKGDKPLSRFYFISRHAAAVINYLCSIKNSAMSLITHSKMLKGGDDVSMMKEVSNGLKIIAEDICRPGQPKTVQRKGFVNAAQAHRAALKSNGHNVRAADVNAAGAFVRAKAGVKKNRKNNANLKAKDKAKELPSLMIKK